MNKREAVKEIAKHPGTFHVSNMAEKALKGEISLDRALHETASHAQTLYAKNIAKKAIDNG
jgi:hypothetical protein